MQYPIKLTMSDGTEKTFWLSDEKLQFGGTDDGVSDVQINGASILQDGVANIPYAGIGVEGIVRGAAWETGIRYDNGAPYVYGADKTFIDLKLNQYRPINPKYLDYAIRAGLISNAEIKDADKPAICATLGVERGLRRIKYVEYKEEGSVGFVVDSDENGNAFELTEIHIYGYMPSSGTSTTMSFAINTTNPNITGGENIIKITPNNSSFEVRLLRRTTWKGYAIVANGGENAAQSPGNAYASNRGASAVRSHEWATANKIVIAISSTIPVGTNFEIWGR